MLKKEESMKKLLFLCAVCLFCALIVSAQAAPVGNPADPKLLENGIIMQSEDANFSVRAGYQGDFVFDRKLKDLDDSEITSHSGIVALNLMKKVDVYGSLGASTGEFVETYGSTRVEYETETSWGWGVGAKAILFEKDNTTIGLDGRYFNAEPDLDKIIIDGVSYSVPSGSVTKASIEYDEYQIALGIAQKFDMFVPYGGVKYSKAKAKLLATISGTDYASEDADSEDEFGLFVGCSIVPMDSVSINVEGRFIDEEALTVSGQIRF